MRYCSTRKSSPPVSLREAVLTGLAPDGGLYMPEEIPRLPLEVIQQVPHLSFQEMSIAITKLFAGDDIDHDAIHHIIENSITFPAPLQALSPTISVLELFHGPSLAFKDFGARFMAQMMAWFIRGEDEPLHILVATSGDTGGAVALGFLNVPGIQVSILYPKGRVSKLQEQQLTTHGGNIHAFEVEGSFDDCQRLVKEAFLDPTLHKHQRLCSANSINIARLIPQTFYYFQALAQLPNTDTPVVFSVPSGNFGNLSAGIMAQRMGASISHFLAATNINDVVPLYLQNGVFTPRASQPTLSNAMDVGNPSNFERLIRLFDGNHETFSSMISGYRFDDEETKRGIKECWEKYHYVADPHGAVGYLALKEYLQMQEMIGVFLETAHPVKFPEAIKQCIPTQIPVPEQLNDLLDRRKIATIIPPTINALRECLLS